MNIGQEIGNLGAFGINRNLCTSKRPVVLIHLILITTITVELLASKLYLICFCASVEQNVTLASFIE